MSDMSATDAAASGDLSLSDGNVPDDTRSFLRLPWTIREANALQEAYARGGMPAAIEACPGRSKTSLRLMARRLGATKPNDLIKPRNRYIWTEHHDDLIRRRLSDPSRVKHPWRDLTHELGRDRATIKARALKIGLCAPIRKLNRWCPQEDDILRAFRDRGLTSLQRRLAKAGYTRSPAAIRVRMTNLRLSRAQVLPEGYHTTRELAGLLGVRHDTITAWVGSGIIKGTHLKKSVWSISNHEVRRFVMEHAAKVHLGKIEAAGARYWFIELLTESKS